MSSTSALEELIRLLVLLASLLFAGAESQSMGDGPQMQRRPITIERVMPMTSRSLPAQVNLRVQGTIGDGCNFPVKVEQVRDGNTVTVTVYREIQPDVACTMMTQPYEDTIQLNGTFDRGSYRIIVNGQVVSVEI